MPLLNYWARQTQKRSAKEYHCYCFYIAPKYTTILDYAAVLPDPVAAQAQISRPISLPSITVKRDWERGTGSEPHQE